MVLGPPLKLCLQGGAEEQVAFDGQTQAPPGKISMDKIICSSGNLGRGVRGRRKDMKSPRAGGGDAVYGVLGFVGREMEE